MSSIFSDGFKNSPKWRNIATSGHTASIFDIFLTVAGSGGCTDEVLMRISGPRIAHPSNTFLTFGMIKLVKIMSYCFLTKSGPSPASFRLFSVFFKQTPIQFLHQINQKNVHPVYGVGIRTHGLQNLSLLP